METQPNPQSNPPIHAEIVSEASRGPIRVVIEQPRGSWIARGLKWFITIVLFLVAIRWVGGGYEAQEGAIQERYHSLNKGGREKVAIIAVEGTIMGDEGFVKSQIDQVRHDDHVKAIVLRIDSPGGTVTGSDYIYHHLKQLAADKQVPLVVSMGSIAASGGYYVAMAAGEGDDKIFAEPTTWTGSIGVIIPHYDLSGMLEKINVIDDSIASNPLKMMGSPTRKFPEPIRAEEQQILKGLVESSFEGFKEIVLAGRAALRDDIPAQEIVFTGRIFTAKQAKEHHLVDQLGFVEDAIDRAISLAGLEKDDVKVVKYHRQLGVMELLLLGPQSRKPPIDLAGLVDLTTPKAYYLWTGLAGLITAAR